MNHPPPPPNIFGGGMKTGYTTNNSDISISDNFLVYRSKKLQFIFPILSSIFKALCLKYSSIKLHCFYQINTGRCCGRCKHYVTWIAIYNSLNEVNSFIYAKLCYLLIYKFADAKCIYWGNKLSIK